MVSKLKATTKISKSFRVRLNNLDRAAKIQVILLLQPGSAALTGNPRAYRGERKRRSQVVLDGSRGRLGEVDRILEGHSGKRLSSETNVLGTVAVETTVAGIEDLALSPAVKTIMENQSITLLSSY